MIPLILLALCVVSGYTTEDGCVCTTEDVVIREIPKHIGKKIGTLLTGSCMTSSDYKSHGHWLKLHEGGFIRSSMLRGDDCDTLKALSKLAIKRNEHWHEHHHDGPALNTDHAHHHGLGSEVMDELLEDHPHCRECYHRCPCEKRNIDSCHDCHHCVATLHCHHEQWSDWGHCSKSCGGGRKFRSCLAHCGTTHHTEMNETCNNHHCPTPEHTCNKLQILHAVAELDTTNKTICNDSSHTDSERFVLENCNVTHHTNTWKPGNMIYDHNHHKCTDIPLYTPVATFTDGKFKFDDRQGFAAVYVGCLDDHSGIKIVTKVCDGFAEVVHLPQNGHLPGSNARIPHLPYRMVTIH